MTLRTGTSGWTFKIWDNTTLYFPPTGRIRGEKQLPAYSRYASAVELNTTFYALPTPEKWEGWRTRASSISPDFRFAVKMWRRATHECRLCESESWWPVFWERAQLLGTHLGPILFQFPPSFKQTKKTLCLLRGLRDVLPSSHPFVFEFRSSTWRVEDLSFFSINWTLALIHVCRGAAAKQWTDLKDGWHFGGIVGQVNYIRLHGTVGQYIGKYEGTPDGTILKKHLTTKTPGTDTYLIFNNTDSIEPDGRGGLPSAIHDCKSYLPTKKRKATGDIRSYFLAKQPKYGLGKVGILSFSGLLSSRYKKYRNFTFGLMKKYTSEWRWRCFISTILVCNSSERAMLKAGEEIFKRFSNAGQLASATVEEMDWIRTVLDKHKINQAPRKVDYIVNASHLGGVPGTKQELKKLPGVGDHVASVTLAWVYEAPEFGVDRHVRRILKRLKFVRAKASDREIEHLVKQKIPAKELGRFSRTLVDLGQEICGFTPRCKSCFLQKQCPSSLEW